MSLFPRRPINRNPKPPITAPCDLCGTPCVSERDLREHLKPSNGRHYSAPELIEQVVAIWHAAVAAQREASDTIEDLG